MLEDTMQTNSLAVNEVMPNRDLFMIVKGEKKKSTKQQLQNDAWIRNPCNKYYNDPPN